MDKRKNRRRSRKGRDEENQRRAALAKSNVAFVSKLKEASPCTDCKEFHPFYVMEYDHLEGTTKIDSVARLCGRSTLKVVMNEIAKCELVCSNCHAKRTYKRSHS